MSLNSLTATRNRITASLITTSVDQAFLRRMMLIRLLVSASIKACVSSFNADARTMSICGRCFWITGSSHMKTMCDRPSLGFTPYVLRFEELGCHFFFRAVLLKCPRCCRSKIWTQVSSKLMRTIFLLKGTKECRKLLHCHSATAFF